MDNLITKATSYQDLLKSFQQAETSVPTPRQKKLIYRPNHTKQSSSTLKSNKQNLPKTHHQSQYQKSISHRSDWTDDDVLKEYNDKRKDKQLELTYNKFITYITNILASLTNTIPPELLVHNISYLQYLAALKQMAMIKDSYEPQGDDAVSGLWNQLATHGHTCGVFILYVAAILNMRKAEDQTSQKYAYLARRYEELRYTRMEMMGKVKTAVEEEEFPFAPAISQRSRTLAASRSRSKKKRDHCLAQRSMQNYMDDDEEETERDQSTFGPIDSLAGNRRSEILYQQAKERSLEKKKRDKKATDVEYERSVDELTFHPRIHPNTTVKTKMKKEIQGEQDSINRIIRGRVEREVRRIINQKGLPYNQKLFEKMKRERYEALQKPKRHQCPYRHPQSHPQPQNQSQQPKFEERVQTQEKKVRGEPIVLTIQVDESRCQKLVIQQPSRYKQAASKFIAEHNLGQQMYDKLLQGVEKALKFQLTQVDEDSCQSQYDSIQ